jgi:poly(beta-D-mannuronate) lyase
MFGWKTIWPVFISLFVFVSGSAASDALRSPWDAPISSTDTAYRCPEPPHLARDLDVNGFYSDERHSIVDEARMKAYEEGSAPFTNLARSVVQAADNYRTTGSQRAAECVITLLDTAAKDGVLAGQMKTAQASYLQGGSLSAWAIGYLKVRRSGAASAEERTAIVGWLKKLAEENRDFYERKSRNPRSDAHNHHLYWAGLAISAAGIAADDHKSFNWGMNAYREGVHDITAEGTLPLEMERAGRALYYHLYALGPLVMLAELGESNGQDLYAEKHQALQRLGERCAAGLGDPSFFVQHTGVAQDMPRGLEAWEIGWATPYLRRFPDAKLAALLANARNLSYTDWGGLPPE